MGTAINPIDPKAAQPKGKGNKANEAAKAAFANTFKNAAKEIYTKVPETLAPYRDDMKKKKLSEERKWKYKDEEEEDSVHSLVQKIEQRLKRLAKMAEEERKKSE